MKTKEIQSLTKEDFIFLEKSLLEIGFVEITKTDSKKTFNRLGLSPPRPITGKEASYMYTNNNYTVKIHTTFLKKEGKWRDTSTDIGWCLIAEKDVRKYFSRPFQRKKGFVLKLLRYAWITKWKVDNRHLCPSCNRYMDIKRKQATRQYFWCCTNKAKHTQPVFLSWDHNLPPKAKQFVTKRRKNTLKYNKNNELLGKNPTPAPVIRKKWNMRNPENQE